MLNLGLLHTCCRNKIYSHLRKVKTIEIQPNLSGRINWKGSELYHQIKKRDVPS